MLSFLYSPTLTSIHDYWKDHSFDQMTFVGKVMSLLFNMLSRLVITLLPRSKRLLIPWLQSPPAVILEPQKIKVSYCFHCFPIYLPQGDGTGSHEQQMEFNVVVPCNRFSAVCFWNLSPYHIMYLLHSCHLTFFSKYKNDSEIPKFFWDPHHLLYYGFRGRGVNKTDPH